MVALGWIVGLALFGAMLGYLVRSWGMIDIRLERVRAGPLALAFVLLGTAYMAQCFAWHRIVRASGTLVSLRTDATRWSLSLLGKYLPGKVWHGVGRLYLYRNPPGSVARIAAALLIEFFLGVAAAALVGAVMLVVSSPVIPWSLLVGLLAVGLIALACSLTRGFDYLAATLSRRLLKQAPSTPAPLRARLVPFAWQVVAQLVLGAGCFVLANSFQRVPLALAPVFIGALCVAGLAGMAAFFVPAGLGVREGALAWILAFSVPPAFAVFIAIVARLWLTVGDVLAVAVARMLIDRRANG